MVGEQNFETWLSSLRQVSLSEDALVLGVPNPFFQEHLTEHYTHVIQAALEHRLKVEFVVIPREPQRAESQVEEQPLSTAATEYFDEVLKKEMTPAEVSRACEGIETIEQLQAREDDLIEQLFKRRLDIATQEATNHSGTNQKRLAVQTARIEKQEKKEEAKREKARAERAKLLIGVVLSAPLLRRLEKPRNQYQNETPSHFATEGGATRKTLKEAERTFKKDPP